MTREQRSAVRIASLLAAILWVVLGLMRGWAPGVWVVLAAVTAIAPSLLAGPVSQWLHERRRPEPQPVIAAVAPVEPPPPSRYELSYVPLSSARADYRLVLSCVVWWRRKSPEPGIPHADPGSLAAEVVLEQSRQLVGAASPEEVEIAQAKLTSYLGVVRADATGHIEVWATDVALRLPESDADRLRRLADVRKEEEVWEHERNHERKKREYLGGDVLKSAGSALVWWLARDESQIDDAVGKIPNLRKLTAAAHDERVPELDVERGELGAQDHLVELIRGLQPEDEDERALLSDSIASALERRGQSELAAKIRAEFDSPDAAPNPEANGHVRARST
ncbi:hypothetical protein REH65_12295 [Saccharopolyspora sp. ID03-671]|uniref:hypothetical protein n=1 Tax=Saccharopolyspora sp. ID03-671 TaxID=3073066 RepID=UPI0032551A8F